MSASAASSLISRLSRRGSGNGVECSHVALVLVTSEAQNQVLSDPDLLFSILSHIRTLSALRPLLRTSKTFRAAAIRSDNLVWCSLSMSKFNDMTPLKPNATDIGTVVRRGMRQLGLTSSIQNTWSSDVVLKILAAKPRITSLDLGGLKFVDNTEASATQVVCALPDTIATLPFRAL